MGSDRRATSRPCRAPPGRWSRGRAAAAAGALVESLERRALLSGGDVDPTFGGGGSGAAFLSVGANDDTKPHGRMVAVQADGKVVVVGAALGPVSAGGVNFIVARLRADGTPDPTFGTRGDGTVLADFNGGFDEAFAVAVQGDGRIVVAGLAAVGPNKAERDWAVARFLPDGRLDPAFGGGDGRATLSLSTGDGGFDESARAVALQPDGRIVLAGTAPASNPGGSVGYQDLAVARLNADGSPDITFGEPTPVAGRRTGARRIALGGDERATGLAIDTAGGSPAANPHFGRIVLAAQDELADTDRSFLVVAVEPDGDLDPTFGAGGMAPGGGGGAGYAATGAAAVVITPGGAVVAAGYGSIDGSTAAEDVILRRFTPDGASDPAFGSGGTVTVPLAANAADRANDLRLAPDGGLLVAGFVADAGTGGGRGAVLRLRPDGSPDPRWPAPAGRAGDPAALRYWGLAAAPDGRLVCAGPSGTGPPNTDTDTDAAVRRYYDDVPAAALTAPDPNAAEAGRDPGSFRFTLDRAAPFDVRIGYEVAGTASPGADYDGIGLTPDARFVLIPAGQTQATLTITPIDNATAEPAETVRLTLLSGPAYAVGASNEATITIADNDAPPAAAIVGRHVFYNHSEFDGNDSAANAADDTAVAADKSALLPGEAASFANVSSYARGINGVMIDVAGLPAGAETGLTADDFAFRSGKAPDPASWQPGPSPVSITVRRGAGDGGADRVTLIWPDYNPLRLSPVAQAVANGWLQVTLLATAHTGLGVADVFYFGNLIGEAAGGDLRVTALDYAAVRMNVGRFAPVNSPFDFDRDGRINAFDLLTARSRLFASLPVLAAPAVAAAPPFSTSQTILRSLVARRLVAAAMNEAAIGE